MSGKIISLINFKGGVGKTTLAVNLAACTAHQHGKKTLLIDLDPQSNSSIWLLGKGRWEELAKKENIHKTSAQLFMGLFNPDSAIAPYTASLGPTLSNLFVLPATYHMIKLESNILRYCDNRKILDRYHKGDEHRFLSDDVPILKNSFDYIFIDCPPNLYYGTGNALCNSDYFLVPVIPDTLSTIGLKLLLRELAGMVSPMLESGTLSKPPALLGVALSRYKSVNEHEKGVSAAKHAIESLREKKYILVSKSSRVFEDQKIRDLIAHSEAMQENLPLCLFDDGCNAFKDVSALTYAIMRETEV